MYKKILVLILVVASSTMINASPFSLLSSITQSGSLAGGIRYAINDSWVVDGIASKSQDSDGALTSSYWADVYYKNWGVIISDSGTRKLNTALAYAVEQSISDKASLGISVKLVEFSDADAQYLLGWDAYLVLGF